MKKFLTKASESITVGLGVALDKTGAKKITEDEMVIELGDKVKVYAGKASHLLSELNSFFKSFSGYLSAQNSASTSFADCFINDEVNRNFSSEGKEVTEIHMKYGSNYKAYFNQFISAPLEALIQENEDLKKLASKRREQLILLKDAEKKLQKLRNENKDYASTEEDCAHKRAKFTSTHNNFIANANKYIEKANTVFAEVYEAYQYYNIQFAQLSAQSYNNRLSDFPMAEKSSAFTSLEQVPNSD